ncbi:MAG: hypothetical protein JWM65_1938 [Sphingomonas bacterium]|nr:hypothetical protein [Sphingomonas bacterium]
MRSRLLTWILPWLAISTTLFLAWMNPGILNPTRVAWLLDGNDHGASAIGMAAYLRAPPAWPSLYSHLLMAPEGIPLALTDGNPLLGLLLRPFASVLPVGVQYVGWWLLACILLHTGFAAALLRRFTPNPIACWIGTALLTLMPVLLARFGHVNLCAQWVILWALWIYVDPARSARLLWWVAATVVALLIHPYLTVMVAAIWASAMLRDLAVTRGGGARAAVIGDIGTVAASVVLVLMFLGTVNKVTMPGGGYGHFSMSLDALWNPNIGTYSTVLPASSTEPAQALEGMNYLGLGLLALLAIALFHAVRQRAEIRGDALIRRLAWLLPAFVVLTLVAMAPHLIWRGAVIATVPLPDWVPKLFDPVRAAGRLFWPVLYTIAFVAIVVVGRMRFGTWLLAAALLLQIGDMWAVLASARGSGVLAAQTNPYRLTRDPRWDALIAQADMIEFEPAEIRFNLELLDEVTWRAVIAGKPVRFYHASREPVAIRQRLMRDSVEFSLGHIDPHRLYVLFDTPPPPMVADRVQKLDGISIIPPTAPR